MTDVAPAPTETKVAAPAPTGSVDTNGTPAPAPQAQAPAPVPAPAPVAVVTAAPAPAPVAVVGVAPGTTYVTTGAPAAANYAQASPLVYLQQQQQTYGNTAGILGLQPGGYQTGVTAQYGATGLAPAYAGLNYAAYGYAGAPGAVAGGTAPKAAALGEKPKPKKRKRKKQYSDEDTPSEEEEEIFEEPEPEPILEPSENWIACDDPACGKWRRIPRDYDTTKFPTFEQMQAAPWFCHMNPDATRNQCSVPEESFDEQQEVILPPKKVKKPRGPRKPKVPKPEPEPEPEPEDEEEDAGEKDDERDEDYNGEESGEESP